LDRLPEIISHIFNAPFVCAYVLIIYYSFYPNKLTVKALLGIIIFLYIIPWGPVLGYSLLRKIPPSRLSNKERIPFVIIGLISYVLGTLYFCLGTYGRLYNFLVSLLLMYAILSTFLIIGNIFSKPSVHVAGFVAPIILLSLYASWLFVALLIIVPFIGWSRIKLKIHTPSQLMLGFLIGFLSAVISYEVTMYIIL